jgi:hypothetical protein
MQMDDIKQGDRVTYAIGDVEYDAVALGSVTTGYNRAIRAGGAFLTLRYLNEQGTPVTVNGAALLGTENTDTSAPRTTGWHARLADPEKRPEPQPVQDAPTHEFAQPAREAPPATLGVGPTIEAPADDTSHVMDPDSLAFNDGSPIVPDETPVDDGQGKPDPTYETKTYADGTTATGIAPLPDLSPAEQDAAQAAPGDPAAQNSALPSAEDLDAVAAEQQVVTRVSNDAVKEPVFSPDAVPYVWHPEMSQSGRDPGKDDSPAAADLAEAQAKSQAEIEAADAGKAPAISIAVDEIPGTVETESGPEVVSQHDPAELSELERLSAGGTPDPENAIDQLVEGVE